MQISDLVKHQLNIFFGDVKGEGLSSCGEIAFARCCQNIKMQKSKYVLSEESLITHSGFYSIFLYYLAFELFQMKQFDIAAKVYYLNKIMNGVDWFYEISLPCYWGVEHPIGSVMGRAEYGNYFYFYQGCTVGGNIDINTGVEFYPVLGERVLMYSNSKILGKSHIGENVVLAANTYIINATIPDNCIVYGQSPNLIIKKNEKDKIDRILDTIWK